MYTGHGAGVRTTRGPSLCSCPPKRAGESMRIAGSWFTFHDGEARPVVRAQLQAADGTRTTEQFLIIVILVIITTAPTTVRADAAIKSSLAKVTGESLDVAGTCHTSSGKDDSDGPPQAADKPRAVSPEGVAYLERLRKGAPFGTNGFSLELLRLGM